MLATLIASRRAVPLNASITTIAVKRVSTLLYD
jgi:hypothetical protein